MTWPSRNTWMVIGALAVLGAVNFYVVPAAFVLPEDRCVINYYYYFRVLLKTTSLGLAGAELLLVAGYMAYGPQRLVWRIILGWMAGLWLFETWAMGWQWGVSWLWGVGEWNYNYEDTTVALVGHVLAVALVCCAYQLGLFAVRVRMRFQSRDGIEPEDSANVPAPPLRFSIAELLWLTTAIALTLAAGQTIPVSSYLQWIREGIVGITILTFLATLFFTAGNLMAISYGVNRFQKQHTGWRPYHLAVFAGASLFLWAAGTLDRDTSDITATFAPVTIFGFFVVGALMLLHLAGWELVWDDVPDAPVD